jgi:hypothetical protein
MNEDMIPFTNRECTQAWSILIALNVVYAGLWVLVGYWLAQP